MYISLGEMPNALLYLLLHLVVLLIRLAVLLKHIVVVSIKHRFSILYYLALLFLSCIRPMHFKIRCRPMRYA